MTVIMIYNINGFIFVVIDVSRYCEFRVFIVVYSGPISCTFMFINRIVFINNCIFQFIIKMNQFYFTADYNNGVIVVDAIKECLI